MSDNTFFFSALVVIAIANVIYAVISMWPRRRERRSVAEREQELLDRISRLEKELAAQKDAADYWMASSAKHSDFASESLRIINDLKRENEAMARKPLTDEQLKECLESGGTTCPRCGDEDELRAGDLEADDEFRTYYQDLECRGCNENFRLVFNLTRVERIED